MSKILDVKVILQDDRGSGILILNPVNLLNIDISWNRNFLGDILQLCRNLTMSRLLMFRV